MDVEEKEDKCEWMGIVYQDVCWMYFLKTEIKEKMCEVQIQTDNNSVHSKPVTDVRNTPRIDELLWEEPHRRQEVTGEGVHCLSARVRESSKNNTDGSFVVAMMLDSYSRVQRLSSPPNKHNSLFLISNLRALQLEFTKATMCSTELPSDLRTLPSELSSTLRTTGHIEPLTHALTVLFINALINMLLPISLPVRLTAISREYLVQQNPIGQLVSWAAEDPLCSEKNCPKGIVQRRGMRLAVRKKDRNVPPKLDFLRGASGMLGIPDSCSEISARNYKDEHKLNSLTTVLAKSACNLLSGTHQVDGEQKPLNNKNNPKPGGLWAKALTLLINL
ncbi:hypothetical protein T265_09061 [Opisthorchis viverrini]|uniref:Uncharacterized protein n=1 Tax=Opisthorchis viverrini TaxID=6198 RepID=A0A074ZBG2_OPIVI|nr:hypothetical protein T265_09061 [Opisthorchis viverrini]KER22927.1 hypothetical protein T265_09061 [Opisthorchis viverrini]